ncbi:choice-of-anchor D domain-containing protein [Bathymodiolus japonicus methanotrophic gill symbiont]|uniref:choice-of-anchor D domain-containing protein n=1 Tax=Bathymodiolus japonicus methanotrophic gill symbiont TaxID=113269 RepID=UPI001C8F178C|nr:choice-of-anchor D domain-containing protein [Bathymodiolus japonicus methanotrophic gill symbiont]
MGTLMTDGVIVSFSWSNNTSSKENIVFKKLDSDDSTITLLDHDTFALNAPSSQLLKSADNLILFTITIEAPSANDNVFNIALFRGDNGASLCEMQPQSSVSGDQFIARVTGQDGMADGLTLTRHNQNFQDIVVVCPLPEANLTVTPQTLYFGLVANNASPQLTVILSNPGQSFDDPVTITNIANTVNCATVGFTPPLTLNPGNSAQVVVTLNHSNLPGQVATINNMMITRNPAVGPNNINCIAESRDPVPQAVYSATGLNFGQVNVGGSDSRSFTVTNQGESNLLITNITPPGLAVYTLAPAAFPVTLAPT